MTTQLNSESPRIAWFVSPHGFGHAARACGVINAIHQISPQIHIDIFTSAPEWFFRNSLSGLYRFHSEFADIGLVQRNSLHEDMPETIRQLNQFLPFAPSRIDRLASTLNALGTGLVVCDIAPVGIAAASEAGIPSVLIENFTWDWIYEQYAGQYPDINRHIRYLHRFFESADYHIQTEPLCRPLPADLKTPPISRFPRTPPAVIRAQLNILQNNKMVLISMGGVPEKFGFTEKLIQMNDYRFVIPGGHHAPEVRDNIVMLPQNSLYYQPDLIQASDIIVGKAGYSTIAEVFFAGAPFMFIPRPNYRESAKLVEYIEKNIRGTPVSEAEFRSGEWISRLSGIRSARSVSGVNGACDAAKFICQKLFPEIPAAIDISAMN